jgi:hypothetical protein
MSSYFQVYNFLEAKVPRSLDIDMMGYFDKNQTVPNSTQWCQWLFHHRQFLKIGVPFGNMYMAHP